MAENESFQYQVTLEQLEEGRRLYQHYIKKHIVGQHTHSRPDIPCSPGDVDTQHGDDTTDGDGARAVTQPDPPTHSDDDEDCAEPELRMSPEKLPFSYRETIPSQGRPKSRPAAVPTWTGSPLIDSDAVIPKGSCAHCRTGSLPSPLSTTQKGGGEIRRVVAHEIICSTL